jgi:hypothetical protein
MVESLIIAPALRGAARTPSRRRELDRRADSDEAPYVLAKILISVRPDEIR